MTHEDHNSNSVRAWQAIVFSAMAGGMAWGIRGQYGHETGAMIAGLLVSLTLALLFCSGWRSLETARAVAWCTVAMGIGGTMTYGQTIGLTQNETFVGNWSAFRWGMLGLSIKGGLWIGFAGFFLGLGLGGVRYRPVELLLLLLGLVAVYFFGMYLLNSPFDPANERVPWIYFSEYRYWKPEGAIKPRQEYWGGCLLALAAATAYAGWWRKDRLARHMAFWGVLGGALGFPGGQCIQAFHGWNPGFFRDGFFNFMNSNMNWWNWMETTFGMIMGATLGFGLWLNRKHIRPVEELDATPISPAVEWAILIVFTGALLAVEFKEYAWLEVILDLGIAMTVIPIAAVAGGRLWPYWMAFPLTLLPIAGKTVSVLAYGTPGMPVLVGWMAYGVLPMSLSIFAAFWFARQGRKDQDGVEFARRGLLLSVWTYYLLNFAFFGFPFPWSEWTARTPNNLVFTVCTIGLTLLALTRSRYRCVPETKST